MSERPEDWNVSYQRWLHQGRVDSFLYETIEINHSSFTSPFYLVNWETDLSVDIDGQSGSPVTFTAARFALEPTMVDGTLDQSASIAISAFDGRVYAALKTISMADRSNPLTITPRFFMSYNLLQVIDPPPAWNVYSITVGTKVVRADMRAAPTRIQRIGRYYTALEFPVLNMLR